MESRTTELLLRSLSTWTQLSCKLHIHITILQCDLIHYEEWHGQLWECTVADTGHDDSNVSVTAAFFPSRNQDSNTRT